MQRTRVMAIGTGLLVGGLLGGTAGLAGWRTPVASAQNREGDGRAARAEAAVQLAKRIADLRAEFHAALEGKKPDRADGLERELHAMAGRLKDLVVALREHGQEDALEMVERALRGDGKAKGKKPDGEPREKKRAEGRDDELAASKKRLQDLEAKLRATAEQLARAEAEGREEEAGKLRAALEKLHARFAEGREKLERARQEGPREKGDRRDEGGPERLDAEARKLQRHHEELQARLEKLERGLVDARERGDEGAIREHEAALDQTRVELKKVRAHLERLHDEAARRAAEGRERADREHHDRREPRPESRDPRRGPPEGAPAEELHRELRAVREELAGLRRQMEEMRALLGRLLHGRGPDGGGRDGERREGERRPDRIEPGRFGGLPGLPGRPGHESLMPYFEALTRANAWFREMTGHVGRAGAPERAVDAVNHAHRAYAEAMNAYERALQALGGRGLTDADERVRAMLDRSRDALHEAMERAAQAARGGDRRGDRPDRKRDRDREDEESSR